MSTKRSSQKQINKEQNITNIYKEYSKEIFRFCMYKLNNKENAEDITSEAFIKLSNQNLAEIENVRAWLFKVARNLIYDKYIRPSDTRGTQSDIEIDEIVNEKDYETSGVEDIAISQELVQIIRNEISKLDLKTSEIIVLKIWDELSFEEIAKIVDEKVSTVKLKYYRGIEKIKASLKAQEKGLKLRSITLPIVIAGLMQIGRLPEFQLSKTLLTNLNIILHKIMAKETLTAGAATGVGAKAAAVSGGILATGIGKVLLGVGGALVLGTAGVAGVQLAKQQVQQPTPTEQQPNEEKPVEENQQLKTYTNKDFPDFSFKYDANEWSLSETFKEVELSPQYYVEMQNKIKNGVILTFILYPWSGGGYQDGAEKGEYFQLKNANILRVSKGTENFKADREFDYYYNILYLNGTKGFRDYQCPNIYIYCGGSLVNSFATKTQGNKAIGNTGFFGIVVKGSNKDITESGADEVVETVKWKDELVSKTITLHPVYAGEYDYKVTFKLNKNLKIVKIADKPVEGPKLQDNGKYIIGFEQYKIELGNATLYFSTTPEPYGGTEKIVKVGKNSILGELYRTTGDPEWADTYSNDPAWVSGKQCNSYGNMIEPPCGLGGFTKKNHGHIDVSCVSKTNDYSLCDEIVKTIDFTLVKL